MWLSALRQRLSGGNKSGTNPTEQFWSWFEANQDELAHFEQDQERIFDKLSEQLALIDPELCFEFGPPEPGPSGTTREFVVSAGGIRSSFPAVTTLVALAPKLERWKVTAFRPRRSAELSVSIGPHYFDPKVVRFSLLSNGKQAGIRLLIPDYDDTEIAFKQMAYLMLDGALGEYDVETKVGLVQFSGLDPSTDSKQYPFAELPEVFDQFVEQLAGRPESRN